MKYKLTDSEGYTRRGMKNETLWGENVTHTATGKGTDLYTNGVIHYYNSPEEATIYNPIHAKITNPICWKSRGRKVTFDGVKGGCKTMTTIRLVALPGITMAQRVEIAIRCAQLIYPDPGFNNWAEKWLSGEDRSHSAARVACAVADAAALEAYLTQATDAVARAAAYETYARAYTANAASRAAACLAACVVADAAHAADVVAYASYAADVVVYAGYAVAYAARAKANVADIIRRVLREGVKP